MTILKPNNNQKNSENNPEDKSDNTINPTDNHITAFIKFLLASTESSQKFRRSFMYIGISFLFLWSLVLTVMLIMRPEKISIGNINLEKGQLTLEDEYKTQKKIYMILSPNGSLNSPWVKTGIQVKKGQRIKINAAGKIHLALSRLVQSAVNDVEIRIPWNDPNGRTGRGERDSWYPEIGNFKIIPEQPFGKLIAAIKHEHGTEQYVPIGKHREFEVEKDGELLLTVNDIWLSPENKDAYLPPDPTGKNRDYYIERVLNSIRQNPEITEQDTEQWTIEKWDEEINKIFEKRWKKWTNIRRKRLDSLWYDDNVGSFSVTISIE